MSPLTRERVHSFLCGISGDAKDPADKLYRVLRARGLRMEFVSNKLTLHLGSPSGDRLYLDDALRKTKAGRLTGQEVVVEDFSVEPWIEFFTERIELKEQRCSSCRKPWSEMLSAECCFAVPVSAAEPFIARLVRATCACGSPSRGSCDGHGADKVLIDFADDCSAVWFEVICWHWLVRNFPSRCAWRVEGNRLTVSSTNHDVLRLYAEIQKASDLLEKHSESLMRYKKRVIETAEARKKKFVGMTRDELTAQLRELFLLETRRSGRLTVEE
ncbi:MAG: hypothetical protein WC712_07410 [Candidatus Brocadiia bacterium]